jgi:hypothetical protein
MNVYKEVRKVNRVGKYASSDHVDEIVLMKMVFELTEQERMIMWSEGYIDRVIEKLPVYARDILENRQRKWENNKEYVRNKLNDITNQPDFAAKMKSERKEFALFVMENYRPYQSLLFLLYDKNLKDDDLRKFVYRRRFGGKKKYLT